MLTRKTSLRVLYTINSSPQYILARWLSPVSVTIISQEQGSQATLPDASPAPALYASVTLKTCLDAICRSSPDLTQDSTRDFSLYVLDPLESNSAPAPVNISNSHGDIAGSTSSAVAEKPRPVAVGLGLMSWALMSSDRESISVTGTLTKQPSGQEALEVIFALRETVAKQRAWDVRPSSLRVLSSSQESGTSETSNQGNLKQPQWYSTSQEQSFVHPTKHVSRSASTSNLTRETVASIQMRPKAKVKAPKQPRYSNTPMTESDKLMNSADTYIGPLKKKGRPKTTNAEPRSSKSQVPAPREVIVLDESDTEVNTFSSQSTKKKHSSQQPRPPPFTTAPLIRHQSQQTVADVQVKAEKSDTALDPLSLLSASLSSVDSSISNTALLTALATIDSTKSHGTQENAQNIALLAALKQLLAIHMKPSASPKTTTFLPTPESTVRHLSQSSSSSHSDDIVILDKENVNPAPSRKYLLDKFSDPLPFTLNSSKERALQSLRPSTRTNELGLTNLPKETPQSMPAVRKRTLSDFMDERESSRRNRGKERETKKRDRHRDSSLQRSEMLLEADTLRHYPQVLAAKLPRLGQPSNYYRTPSDPLTSPVRGRADNDENEQFPGVEGFGSNPWKHLSPRNPRRVSASSPIRPKERKKYVVPEWARTNTATRPRLSEEAKRALEEAEARKREERNASRRKLAGKHGKMRSGESIDTANAEPLMSELPSCSQFVLGRKSDLSQGPISASSDGPVIAFSLVSTPRASSPPLLPSVTLQTPKTPSKSRGQSITGNEEGSLFTPITGGGSLFGSAVSRRTDHGTPPSVLTSPLGNRKKAKVSSTQSMFTACGITALHAWSTRSSPKSSTDSVVSEDHSRLGKESEDQPGSLCIASSDIDLDWSALQPTSECRGDADTDDSGEQTVKQHWAGLPPSSPPPPSSPMLIPENRADDEDMDELPIATSDSEADAEMNAFDIDDTSHNDASGGLEAEATQLSMNLTDEDYRALFSLENHPSSFPLSSSTTLDLFEQFTTVNAQSDDNTAICGSFSTNPEMQTMFQNGIGNLDFTEFWETFKPMVSENTLPCPQENIEQSFAEFFGDAQLLHGVDVDHGKLADDMQSLFSGYLV